MHRRVADDRELPTLVETAQEVARRHRVGAGQVRAPVDVVVDAVVEIVRLEVAQAALLVQRGQELAHRLEVRVHRAADVHQEE